MGVTSPGMLNQACLKRQKRRLATIFFVDNVPMKTSWKRLSSGWNFGNLGLKNYRQKTKFSLKQCVSLNVFFKNYHRIFQKKALDKGLINILRNNKFFEWLEETIVFFKRFESAEVEKINSSFHNLLYEYLSDWYLLKNFVMNIRMAKILTRDIHAWEHNFSCYTNGQHRNLYSKT